MAVASEFRETRLRLILTLCVSVGVGAAYAAPLVYGLRTTYEPVPPRAPVRVAFASEVSVGGIGIAGGSPGQNARLPVNVPSVAHAAKEKPARRDTAPATANSQKEAETSTAPAQTVPPVPPAPPDEYAELQGRTYPELPGGPVMVMALLLDEAGTVQNARIVVPSRYPAGDLTYLMMLPGTQVPVPEPGIAPGETRWIERRFRYESEAVLP